MSECVNPCSFSTLVSLIHSPAQIDKYLIRIAYLHKSKARVLEVDDDIRGHRQDYGEGDGVQHIQMTSYRHVVAREQRARESQRAEHREDDHWRIKSSGLCSRRGDVEDRAWTVGRLLGADQSVAMPCRCRSPPPRRDAALHQSV